MGKARVVWTAEKYQRLLAATIVAHPNMKLVWLTHVLVVFH
jgi:hypothetical protein